MPAPIGNKNALKHGLYANRVTKAQQAILGKVETLDVEHEIAVLRAVIDNILGEIEDTDRPETKAMLYNSLFGGVTSLNTTIRTHALLSGKDSELEEQIEQGKIFARKRLNVHAYLTVQDSKPGKSKGRRTGRKPK